METAADALATNSNLSDVTIAMETAVNFSKEETTFRSVTIVSPVMTFLTGVMGNVIALVVLHRTRTECTRSVFYVLVAGLVWTDLLGQLLTTPIPLAVYMNDLQWIGGTVTCQFHAFVMMCAGLTTPAIVCTMAVERYVSLKKPYFYQRHFTQVRARVYLVTLWTTMIVFAACPLVGWGSTTLQFPGTWCYLNSSAQRLSDIVYTYIYALYTVLMILITVWCNFVVMQVLIKLRQKRARETSPSKPAMWNSNNSRTNRQSDIEIQMVVLLIAITLVFTICWTPITVRQTTTTNIPAL